MYISLLLLNPAYYGKFFLHPKENSSKMNAIGESSFFFAILGTGLYIIMGICSLPSVGSHMTNKQWQLVYGPLAWIALLFGTLHVMIMGVKGWDDEGKWPGGMPPITLTSVLVPLLAFWLKLVQILLGFLQHNMGISATHVNIREPLFQYKQKEKTAVFHDEEQKSMLPLANEPSTNGTETNYTNREVTW